MLVKERLLSDATSRHQAADEPTLSKWCHLKSHSLKFVYTQFLQVISFTHLIVLTVKETEIVSIVNCIGMQRHNK